MNPDITQSPSRARDLSNLAQTKLSPPNQRLHDAALASVAGSATWRARKTAEAFDLFALSQASGRYRIDAIDLSVDLRVLITMQVAVPCLPDPAGPLRFAPFAQFGFVYPEQSVRWLTPGTQFVQLFLPRTAWLPNLSQPIQSLCLGTSLPAGIRATEILHMVYGALTLQSVQMDLMDAAGVLNPEAALWWQRNLEKVPTTREGFALGTPPKV